MPDTIAAGLTWVGCWIDCLNERSCQESQTDRITERKHIHGIWEIPAERERKEREKREKRERKEGERQGRESVRERERVREMGILQSTSKLLYTGSVIKCQQQQQHLPAVSVSCHPEKSNVQCVGTKMAGREYASAFYGHGSLSINKNLHKQKKDTKKTSIAITAAAGTRQVVKLYKLTKRTALKAQ